MKISGIKKNNKKGFCGRDFFHLYFTCDFPGAEIGLYNQCPPVALKAANGSTWGLFPFNSETLRAYYSRILPLSPVRKSCSAQNLILLFCKNESMRKEPKEKLPVRTMTVDARLRVRKVFYAQQPHRTL